MRRLGNPHIRQGLAAFGYALPRAVGREQNPFVAVLFQNFAEDPFSNEAQHVCRVKVNVLTAKHMLAKQNVFSATFRLAKAEDKQMAEETEAQTEAIRAKAAEITALAEEIAALEDKIEKNKEQTEN